jgi:hypothetical protein
MDIVTSNYMLLLIFAASCLTEDFSIYILSHKFGGCIGSVMGNYLVTALLLCAKDCQI